MGVFTSIAKTLGLRKSELSELSTTERIFADKALKLVNQGIAVSWEKEEGRLPTGLPRGYKTFRAVVEGSTYEVIHKWGPLHNFYALEVKDARSTQLLSLDQSQLALRLFCAIESQQAQKTGAMPAGYRQALN